MSTCSCVSDENATFWKKLALKYEQRIDYLQRKTAEVRKHVETMQMQMPAYFCYRLLQYPGNIKENTEKFKRELQQKRSDQFLPKTCSCNPCPVKIPANFPENLYDYEYPTKIGMYVKSYLKPKKPIRPLNKDCSCRHCAERVIKKLLAEKEAEPKPETKVSIKRICQCDVCKSMIPERECKEIKVKGEGTRKVIECACAKDGRVEKIDVEVCECSICAEEVIKRIQSSAVEFEPLTCGCEGQIVPPLLPTDIDVPICKCESCKEALNERLGVKRDEEKSVQAADAACVCKTHPFSKQICKCNICAESLIPLESCSCKTDVDVPICTCSTCNKEGKKVIDITDVDRCLCRCEICNERRIAAQTPEKEEEEQKSCLQFIPCICNCKICNKPRVLDDPTCLCRLYQETGAVSDESIDSKCSGRESVKRVNSNCICGSNEEIISIPPQQDPCMGNLEDKESLCKEISVIKPLTPSFTCNYSPEENRCRLFTPTSLDSNVSRSTSSGTCTCPLCNSQRVIDSIKSSSSSSRSPTGNTKDSGNSCPCSLNLESSSESSGSSKSNSSSSRSPTGNTQNSSNSCPCSLNLKSSSECTGSTKSSSSSSRSPTGNTQNSGNSCPCSLNLKSSSECTGCSKSSSSSSTSSTGNFINSGKSCPCSLNIRSLSASGENSNNSSSLCSENCTICSTSLNSNSPKGSSYKCSNSRISKSR